MSSKGSSYWPFQLGLAAIAFLSLLLPTVAFSQTVTNVRAQQLADKTVEVLYDLSGAASGGATVTIAFSSDGGSSYAISPGASTLTGNVGTGVTSGTNRRIVWSAAATLSASTYGTNYRAAVTATNPSSGGQEITVMLPGNVPLVMVKIPKGTFLMGSPTTERGRQTDETLHQVTLTSDFYIGKYEVTQRQWKAVTGKVGSTQCGNSWSGDDYPVACVSWSAIAGQGGFIEKLNQQQGTTKFRLPTEAEWERAVRAGTQTRFSFGDALECDDVCGACSSAGEYVHWCGATGSGPRPVGMRLPNPYGLSDMHGNLAEWVQDNYGAFSSTSVTDPIGSGSANNKVVKGGSFSSSLRGCRSTSREEGSIWGGFAVEFNFVGFRLAKSE